MKFVQAKCTNCAANLQVDATKDAAICEACDSAFVVEKAVNHYNTTNNIKADVVNVYGGDSTDFVIRAGTLEKYTGAATEVVIPNSVTIIGYNAFLHCQGMTKVTIPNSVAVIGHHAFAYCTGLTSIVIPNSVTLIEARAFLGCDRLTDIAIPNNTVEIQQGAFENCVELSINIPNNVMIETSNLQATFRGVKSVSIATGVKVTFNDITRFDSIFIPDIVNLQQLLAAPYSEVKDLLEIISRLGKPRVFNGVTYQQVLEIYNKKAPKPKQPWIEPQPKKSGCYIATAIYGSYDAPEVLTLRQFRDNTLKKSKGGRLFIRTYYRLSPPIAEKLKNAKMLNRLVRKILDKLVSAMQ